MRVYNFNLLLEYYPGGVDTAQIERAKLFKAMGLGEKSQFITNQSATYNSLSYYIDRGLPTEQITIVQQTFSDIRDIVPSIPVENIIDELSPHIQLDTRREQENGLVYLTKDKRSYLDIKTKTISGKAFVETVSYGRDGYFMRVDHYSSHKWCTDYYSPVVVNGGKRAFHLRRVYYNKNGTVALEQAFSREGVANHLQARVYSQNELICKYLENENLNSDDIIILDHSWGGLLETLSRNKGKAKFALFIHSEHFYDSWKVGFQKGWNPEYYQLFDHINVVDYLIVSTEVQAQALRKDLNEFLGESAYQPKVIVLPVGIVDKVANQPLEHNDNLKLITASRLDQRKKIDWIIKAAVAAKKELPQLTLDIYGEGPEAPILEGLIKNLDADNYIKLKGFANVKELYHQYDAFISGSIWETFGLSLLEAAAFGLPLIGLNISYGNPTLIKNGKNGFLVPYYDENNDYQAIESLKSGLIQLGQHPDRRSLSQASLNLAKNYQTEKIAQLWLQFFEQLDK